MRLLAYVKLIRVYQWYKNLVVFLPLVFAGMLFVEGLCSKVLIGFFALCAVSSANYVINDLIDRKRDCTHPEKRQRPLASGVVSAGEAVLLAAVLLGVALLLAYPLSFLFFLTILFLFFFTLVYTLLLKHEPIADVVAIAINFVVRAIAGALIIKVLVSPWLVLCPFFLALVLVVGKRHAELQFMKKRAGKYKEVLRFYSPELIRALMIVSITSLVLSYSLYSFSRTSLMLLTVPFAVYGIFRYFYLVQTGSVIARHPERIYKDVPSVIVGVLWALLVFLIFYVIQGKIDVWSLV